jgi:hypothetical protein
VCRCPIRRVECIIVYSQWRSRFITNGRGSKSDCDCEARGMRMVRMRMGFGSIKSLIDGLLDVQSFADGGFDVPASLVFRSCSFLFSSAPTSSPPPLSLSRSPKIPYSLPNHSTPPQPPPSHSPLVCPLSPRSARRRSPRNQRLGKWCRGAGRHGSGRGMSVVREAVLAWVWKGELDG